MEIKFDIDLESSFDGRLEKINDAIRTFVAEMQKLKIPVRDYKLIKVEMRGTL